MTKAFVAHTDLNHSQEAGTYLGSRIRASFENQSPDVVLLFASSKYEYSELLKAVHAACQPKILIGCSSAGEFINGQCGDGTAAAIAFSSNDMKFKVAIGRGLRANRAQAAQELVNSFSPTQDLDAYPWRSALLLTDALAGEADDLVERINAATGGVYQLFGGAAGDDVRYDATYVFNGTEAINDAVLGLEILSKKPVGIGITEGWEPASEPLRVTEADGARIISLNSIPTREILKQHALQTGQNLELNSPFPFLMHNIFGIVPQPSSPTDLSTTKTGHKLRVPVAIHADGSVQCAAEVPVGSLVQLMRSSARSTQQAANQAIQDAVQQLNGQKPQAAIIFDCVATRLRTGQGYQLELESLTRLLGSIPFAGLNTYGQIGRVQGQFVGFHHATSVVCLFS